MTSFPRIFISFAVLGTQYHKDLKKILLDVITFFSPSFIMWEKKVKSVYRHVVVAFTQGQHDNASSPATAGASDNNIPSSSSSTTTTQSPPSSSTSPVPTTTRAPPPPATAAINGTVPTWTVRSSYSSCVLVSGNFSFAVTYTDDSSENVCFLVTQ